MTTIPLHTYLEEVNQLLDDERFNEAARHCRHILKHFPRHVDTYRLLARALLGLEEFEPAHDMFQRVLSAEPNDLIAHIALSDLYAHQNQPEQAVWHLQRAFELQPYNGAIREELNKLTDRTDETVAYEKIQLNGPALANLNVRSELFDQAITVLREELEKSPDRIDLELLLAEAFWRDGNRIEGAKIARNVLKRLPNCVQANAILAHIWLGSARANDARPYLQRLQSLVQMDQTHLDLDSPAGEALLAGHASALPEVITLEPLDEAALLTDPTVEWSSDMSVVDAENGDVHSEPGDMYSWLSGITEQGKVSDDEPEAPLKPPMETAVPDETNWFTDEAAADAEDEEEDDSESVTNWLGSEWEGVTADDEQDDIVDISWEEESASETVDAWTKEQPIPDWLTMDAAEEALEDDAESTPEPDLSFSELPAESAVSLAETDEDAPDWLFEMTSTDFEAVDPSTVGEADSDAADAEMAGDVIDEAADWLAELSDEIGDGEPDAPEAPAAVGDMIPSDSAAESDVGDWLMDLAADTGESLDFDSDLLADAIPSDSGLTGLLSTEEPVVDDAAKAESSASDAAVDDWLGADWLEEGAETAVPDAEADAELEAVESPQAAAEDETSTPSETDWLAALTDESPAPVADDWLAELAAEPTGFTENLPEDADTAGDEDDLPDAPPDPDDWLAALAASPEESIGDSDMLQSDDSFADDSFADADKDDADWDADADADDWLASLAETAAEFSEFEAEPDAEAQQAEEASESEELAADTTPDWLSDASAELETPISGTDLLAMGTDESEAAQEIASEADFEAEGVDDWLTDLAALESGPLSEEPAEATAADDDFDQSVPDWLRTQPFTDPTNAEADVMDTGDDPKQDEPRPVPPTEPEEPASEPEEDAALTEGASIDDATTDDAATDDTSIDDVAEDAAWLSELLEGAADAESAESTDIVPDETDSKQGDDTWSGLEAEPSLPEWMQVDEETAVPNQPDDIPNWLQEPDTADVDFVDTFETEQAPPTDETSLFDAPPTQLLDDLSPAQQDSDDAPSWLQELGFDDLEDETTEAQAAEETPDDFVEEPAGGTELLSPPTSLLDDLTPELDDVPDIAFEEQDTGWLQELANPDEEQVSTPLPELDWLDEDETDADEATSIAPEIDDAMAETAVDENELDDVLDADLIPDVPSDLDDAMSWLEELAAEETAPVEPLPTVADVIDDELMMLDDDEAEADAPAATPEPPLAAAEEAADADLDDAMDDLDDAMAWLDELAEETDDEDVLSPDAADADDWLDAASPSVPTAETEAEETAVPDEMDVPEDLDDAMAWLEQLAAKQGAPVEELPSLAAAEDAEAATAADDAEEAQPAPEPEVAMESEPPAPPETSAAEPAEPVMGDVPEDIDAAMAWLEELAAKQGAPAEELPSLSETADAAETAALTPSDPEPAAPEMGVADAGAAELDDELADALDWLEEVALDDAAETVSPTAAELAPASDDELAEALDWLETLAQQPTKTAADADAETAVAETPESMPDDEPSAAEAVEAEPEDAFADLFDIPDDPDAALAWLEEAADEGSADEASVDETPADETPVDETPTDEAPADAPIAMMDESDAAEESAVPAATDADPFDIPDDPDAALAWLEEIAEAPETASEVAEPPTPVFTDENETETDEETEETDAAAADAPETLVHDEAPAEDAGDDLTDAFLSEVPEDPDEAMAWLEQLAARQGASLDELPTVSETPDADEALSTPEWVARQAAAAAEDTVDEEAVSAADAEPEQDDTPPETDAAVDDHLFDDDADISEDLPSWMGYADESETAVDDIVDLPQSDWLKSMPELNVTGWLEAEDEASAEEKGATGPLPDTGPLPPSTSPAPPIEDEPLEFEIDELALGEPDSSVYAVDEEELSRAQAALAEGAYETALSTFQTLVSRGEGMMVLIGELEGAVDTHTDQPALRRLLGDAYMRNGQLQKALQTYRQALDQL